MTQTETPRSSAPERVRHRAEPERNDGWVGWIYFAGLTAILIGFFQAIAGLTALFNDDYFLVARSGLVLDLDFTAWGWIHLGMGVLLIAVGVGMCLGQMWARVVGVAIAGLSAVANFLFLAAYPVWSTIMIALDVLVIYALVAHGREVKA